MGGTAMSPVVQGKESENVRIRRRKSRNAIAWGLISLIIGLLFGTDAGLGSFRRLLSGLDPADAGTIALIVPMYAFLICLMAVFGDILGQILTQLVWEREKEGLDSAGSGNLLQRNILADLAAGLVALQERFVPIWLLEKGLGNETLEYAQKVLNRVIAFIGGIAGTFFLVIFARTFGDLYEFGGLYVAQILVFVATLFALTFTSLPSFSLLLLVGLTFVYNGFLVFMGGDLWPLGLIQIIVGGFFLLVFLRALQWQFDPTKASHGS